MRIINQTEKISKKDMVNARSASASLQDAAGTTISVVGAMIAEDTDASTGETQNKGFLFCADGTVYGTVSATAITCIDGLIDCMTDDPDAIFDIDVVKKQSKSGRDFLQLIIR